MNQNPTCVDATVTGLFGDGKIQITHDSIIQIMHDIQINSVEDKGSR